MFFEVTSLFQSSGDFAGDSFSRYGRGVGYFTLSVSRLSQTVVPCALLQSFLETNLPKTKIELWSFTGCFNLVLKF